MSFDILVQIKVHYALYRIEETKLECAISRKLIFDWKTFFFSIEGPKMDLKLTYNGFKMIPNERR